MRRLASFAIAMAALLAAGAPTPAHASPDTWGQQVRLDVETVDVPMPDGSRLRTAYALLGPSSAPPLLLLNGTGSPMAQWDPALLNALARSRQVLVYDYPGLGGSTPLPRTLTFDALADHAAGLLDALDRDRTAVLGWSMGGFVAQRLAVRHPDRLDALVLAATNPGGPRATLGPAWVQAEDSDPDASARAYVRANYPVGYRDRGWAFVRRVDAAVDSGRYPPERIPARVYDAMVAAEDPWLESGANLRDLRDLRGSDGGPLRTLVVTGGKDVVTPPANSRVLADAIPEARLVLVPESGHSFLFQVPARAAAVVVEFLDRA